MLIRPDPWLMHRFFCVCASFFYLHTKEVCAHEGVLASGILRGAVSGLFTNGGRLTTLFILGRVHLSQ